MSFRFILTKKNHLILEYAFSNAPKSYEESLANGRTPHIPAGKNYKDTEKEYKIIRSLFEAHINKVCICDGQVICLFKRYENKEITIEDVAILMK
jgi:hypothetical protein